MTKLMKKIRRPPFKCHGGKYYLCRWVVDHFPENYQNMVYVEPYCGGASVFLNKDRSIEECLNDLDLGIIQIYRALRDEPTEFIGRLKRIAYSERSFENFAEKLTAKEFPDYLSHALAEFSVRRMSRGGMKKHFAWSNRKRGGQPGDLNAWNTILAELPLIAQELTSTYITNEHALKVIKVFNSKDTLLYLDPPYLPETRASLDVYDHEMSTDDHIELAEALNSFKGKVILSGYPSKLYKRLYDNVKVLTKDKIPKSKWRVDHKSIVNHSSQVKKKDQKVEMLWMNY